MEESLYVEKISSSFEDDSQEENQRLEKKSLERVYVHENIIDTVE